MQLMEAAIHPESRPLLYGLNDFVTTPRFVHTKSCWLSSNTPNFAMNVNKKLLNSNSAQ